MLMCPLLEMFVWAQNLEEGHQGVQTWKTLGLVIQEVLSLPAGMLIKFKQSHHLEEEAVEKIYHIALEIITNLHLDLRKLKFLLDSGRNSLKMAPGNLLSTTGKIQAHKPHWKKADTLAQHLRKHGMEAL